MQVDSILLVVTAFAAVVSLLLVFGVIVQRISHVARERRLQAGVDKLKYALVSFLLGEQSMSATADAMAREPQAAELLLLRHLEVLQGQEREQLMRLARELGFVERNAHALRSPDWTRREIAAMHLGIFALPETVPDLARALNDRRSEVRYTAARSLAQIGSPEAFSALIGLFRRPGLLDTPRLLEIVQQTSRTEIEPLELLLKEESLPTSTRLLLIDLAGDWRELRLVEVLRDFALGDDVEVAVRAIKALRQIGDPDSVPVVLTRIDDPQWEVRAQVVKTLGVMDFDEAAPLLKRALTDQAYWVRRNAAEALVEFGPIGEQMLRATEDLDDRFATDMARYQLERTAKWAGTTVQVAEHEEGQTGPEAPGAETE